MTRPYHEDDIRESFNWLANSRFGYTELLAVHRDYLPGKDNFRENREHGRLPKVWYVKEAAQAFSFVSRFCADHTCYFGVNPRPAILRSDYGRARSAKEIDIQVMTTFFFDLDCLEKELTDEHLAEVQLFLTKTEGFFEDIGVKPPTLAFSGRGYHQLFSPSPIRVNEHPEIKQRLHEFKRRFEAEFRRDMSQLRLRIDSTLDLRRMAKIYGTKKADPQIKGISRFYGGKREDDPGLNGYLMSLRVKEPVRDHHSILRYGELPERFKELLGNDKSLSDLWDGVGKVEGDVSCTGYDFSIVMQCIKRGITDVNELASILARRPNGAYRKSGKDKGYIRRTIGKAIMSC